MCGFVVDITRASLVTVCENDRAYTLDCIQIRASSRRRDVSTVERTYDEPVRGFLTLEDRGGEIGGFGFLLYDVFRVVVRHRGE